MVVTKQYQLHTMQSLRCMYVIHTVSINISEVLLLIGNLPRVLKLTYNGTVGLHAPRSLLKFNALKNLTHVSTLNDLQMFILSNENLKVNHTEEKNVKLQTQT